MANVFRKPRLSEETTTRGEMCSVEWLHIRGLHRIFIASAGVLLSYIAPSTSEYTTKQPQQHTIPSFVVPAVMLLILAPSSAS